MVCYKAIKSKSRALIEAIIIHTKMWAFSLGGGEPEYPRKIFTTFTAPDEVSQIVKKLSPWFVNSIICQLYDKESSDIGC